MATPLANAIAFLDKFGFFDVLAPFLLIFTLTFAILEKTKVLGVTDKGKPKININSMIAFVIALFFIAIPRVVTALKLSIPYVAFLLMVILAYMLLVGSYASGNEPFSFEKRKFWKGFLGILIFLSLLAIFLNSFGWLDATLDYITENWKDTFIVSLIFVAAIIGAIFWITSEKREGAKGE